MNRFLNIIEKLLTMFLSVTYFFAVQPNLFIYIFVAVISIFTFCTSIVDIIKFKKKDIKQYILNIILILLLLLNIYRPFIDCLLIKGLDFNLDMRLNYCRDILNQNFILVTIFMIILFVLNFKFDNK